MHHSDLCTAPALSCGCNPMIQLAVFITAALTKLSSCSGGSSFPGKWVMLLGSPHLSLLVFFFLCHCCFVGFLCFFFFLLKKQTLLKSWCLLRLPALPTFHAALLLKGLSVCPTLKIIQEKLQRSYIPSVSENSLCIHIICQ